MRRCSHSVYWPEGQPFAWGCGFCNKNAYNGHKAEQGKFVMPRRVLSEQDGHVRGNRHTPGFCPKCGSGIHTVQSKTIWKCVECDTTYDSPRASMRRAAACAA